MSTRSNIAIEDPKTKNVKVIYVHSDGYPYGVGHCLVDNYNSYDLAKELFQYGDASYLDETIDQCSFYGRDWERKIDKARTYRDEWMYMYNMRGEPMIEYIYIFKSGRWFVSTSKYIKYKGKHEKHAEVKMIGQIGKLLSGAGFKDDDVMVQGGKVKKAN